MDGADEGLEVGLVLGDLDGAAEGEAVASATERKHKSNAKGSSNSKLMTISTLGNNICLV